MSAQVGSEGMRKANLNQPSDLISFPWDRPTAPPITPEEQQDLQDLMAAENARLQEEREAVNP